ncbi:hypothetical protein F444_14843, partial [Phytophthora nicotianae P1976]
MLQVSGPYVVDTSDYEWPTKMLLRPRTETGAVRMVQLHPRPQPVLITMAKPLMSNSQAVLSVVKPEVPLTSRTIAVQTDPVMVNVGTQTDFPDNDTQDASSTLVEPVCSDRASERCAASQVAGVSEIPNDDTSSDEEPDAQVHETLGRAVEQLESEYARVPKVNDEEVLTSDVPEPDLGACPESNILNLECAPLSPAARVMAVLTRTAAQADAQGRPPMGPLEYQAERWRRIKAHQEENESLKDLIDFLNDDMGRFSPRRLKKIAKIADLYTLDARGELYRLAGRTPERPRDAESELRLVVPEALQDDMLHFAHEDVQGGHQGITRTFEKLRSEFYWSGMHADVERFAKECLDCASGKGRPPNEGPSPGNIEPRRPFEV